MHAAESVFAEQGVHEARMEAIAARACVSVGTLYNYFSDRNALVDSLVIKTHEDMTTAVDAALAGQIGQHFEARLQAFVGALMVFVAGKRPFMASLFESRRHNESVSDKINPLKHSDMMKELYERAASLCQTGVAEGALRPGDADLYPAMLLGILRGTLTYSLFNGAADVAGLAKPATHFFLHGASAEERGQP